MHRLLAGTSSQQHHITTTLRQFAVYIANLFFLTSDAWAPVVSDVELNDNTAEQYNLILVGSPLENSWVQKYHGKVPLQYMDNTLTLGKFGISWSPPQPFFGMFSAAEETARHFWDSCSFSLMEKVLSFF